MLIFFSFLSETRICSIKCIVDTESAFFMFHRSECALQCIADAVGDCYKEDALMAWEPNPTKVFIRAMCANQTGNVHADMNYISYSILPWNASVLRRFK